MASAVLTNPARSAFRSLAGDDRKVRSSRFKLKVYPMCLHDIPGTLSLNTSQAPESQQFELHELVDVVMPVAAS